MFASIAPRYDLLNRLLSFGWDRRWRARLVSALPALTPSERVLDLCTGTGDVALELARRVDTGVRVHASDFCEDMLARAPVKGERGTIGPAYVVADAQALPYGDGGFRAVTVAFGLRNIEDPDQALSEMARVLAPGGRLLILEFGRPQNRVFAAIYKGYFFHVLPCIGRMLSRSKVDAYRYLPESVWAFHAADQLGAMLGQHGLRLVEQRAMMLGAVMLHIAERSET